ncbi:MAG TPA: hypothetical protein EYQ86_01250 [Bacteroidetes bacterium]|nr:hypothetical protein [Bacteroidota bacterium]
MISNFNLLRFLESAIKWRKKILILTTLAFVLSLAVSYIVPPTYESIATIFPSNPALSDEAFSFQSGMGTNYSDLYGSKEDIDRIISIAKSGQVLVHVINEFDLFKHYEIDTSDKEKYKFPLSSAMSQLKKNLKVIKTEFRGIEIKVKDKNPNMASEIANAIVSKVDMVAKDMIQTNRLKMLSIFNKAKTEKDVLVEKLTDSLSNLRKYHSIYNHYTQSSTLTNEVTKTTASLSEYKAQKSVLSKSYKASDPRLLNLTAQIAGLQEKLKTLTSTTSSYNLSKFAKASEQIKLVETKRNAELGELVRLKKIYDYYLLATNENISYIYVMEEANPAEKEVPLMLLLVTASVLLTLFISIITVTILDAFKL